MISEEEFKALGEVVREPIEGARLVEEVNIMLLYGILTELRSNREATQQLAAQFSQVSARGTSLLTEQA